MAANNKPDSKRGIPGGFFLILLAIILIFLTIQNFSSSKSGKVAFSHQAEHLVNMDLIDKADSKKIALNDNLVTFSGRFKERLSDEAKARYRYLEFLDKNHQLKSSITTLDEQLAALHEKVIESAQTYFLLTGTSLPKEGFAVVDSAYDTPDRENSIIISKLPNKKVISLTELNSKFASIEKSPSAESFTQFRSELLSLIKGFRSPTLGIGTEATKDELKEIEQRINAIQPANSEEALAIYKGALGTLNRITSDLAEDKQGFALLGLRSVRNYKTYLDQYYYALDELEKNQVQLDKSRQNVADAIWFFNNKEVSTKTLEAQDPEVYSHWFAQAKQEWENFPENRATSFKAPDQPRNLVLDRTFKSQEPSPNYFSILFTILPILLVVMLLYFVFSRQMKGVGSSAMNFGKSPARLLTKDQNKMTFKDVAGCDEAKEELQEIVEFLKDPGKFTALGATIPKGVLCIGAPGTGKTLIARAVAGEADRPFFFISGSDFVEMFVGVGASRIRDLFDQAKKNAPCIIFIDEIDAVGRHRGSGIGGGHDEREQTLNQLLVEMDGFNTSEGVILIAATNRPDVLDKALMRPGRFDRRVVIDLPDIKGRFEILKVHARKIKLDASVNLMDIARNTPGASGADLANILNEAALLAARIGRNAVTAAETMEACDKVRYGKERRSVEIDRNEKLTTAYHESGHAVVALVVKHVDPVEKVTIIPRGMSLGATHFLPKKNRLSYWKTELLDQLAVLMGGRVAEELCVGDISSGAQMDFTQATRLARSMVCEWGMTQGLGTVSYDERSEQGQYLGLGAYHEKSYSETTAKAIDDEVRRLLDEAYKKAVDIINTHKAQVELMTQMLLEFETLDREDVLAIAEGRWDIEKKRKRLADLENQGRKLPPPPPKKLAEKEAKPRSTDDPSPQQI
jgi:cell division protease FtsH